MSDKVRMIDQTEVARSLTFDRLVPTLRDAFVTGANVPTRHHHDIDGAGTLLLMPSWITGGHLGVKIASIFPDNRSRGLPSVSSTYLLCDASTGEQLAVLDAVELTRRRTIATSALAASYLARADARTLLVVGSGAVASLAAHAYRAVRPITRVLVWNRTPEGADALVASLNAEGIDAHAVTDLRIAVGEADAISCATLATTPLVHGVWLQPGTHLDLIGSFRPDMRETDDAAIRSAGVFVDTLDALTESGDLAGPMHEGALTHADIRATLPQLCRGEHAGRVSPEEITVFKSVGTALADLSAATLVYDHHRNSKGETHVRDHT